MCVCGTRLILRWTFLSVAQLDAPRHRSSFYYPIETLLCVFRIRFLLGRAYDDDDSLQKAGERWQCHFTERDENRRDITSGGRLSERASDQSLAASLLHGRWENSKNSPKEWEVVGRRQRQNIGKRNGRLPSSSKLLFSSSFFFSFLGGGGYALVVVVPPSRPKLSWAEPSQKSSFPSFIYTQINSNSLMHSSNYFSLLPCIKEFRDDAKESSSSSSSWLLRLWLL